MSHSSGSLYDAVAIVPRFSSSCPELYDVALIGLLIRRGVDRCRSSFQAQRDPRYRPRPNFAAEEWGLAWGGNETSPPSGHIPGLVGRRPL